ncbi:methyltransferase domain-containing protein [Simiduia curdlanivorans]|uniref:Class I SAM-dependent methyltransferase n=1 Tax=Simiduia curdlanivorans TaxID=1492769 RepID=A0ABV8V3G1_9GAMM|nr:class I SAM-dependent methyltransferase [Simiduia curdlanivorans]MDN3640017.1 methyltransferase domain-containing protein [Simiduia curdlanivorans]
MGYLTPPERFKRLPRLSHWGRGLPPLSEAVPAMEAWFRTPVGRELLSRELQQVDEVLQCLFGYHLCQMSVCRNLELTATSRILHRFNINPLASASNELHGPAALAHPEQLPLPAESTDVVLLHHVLEFSNQPHQVLREACRVLMPRGHLVIVGFNPWSLMGLWKQLARLGNEPHWRYQAFSVRRLNDWLRLLDLEVSSLSRGFYRFPLQSAKGLSLLHGWDNWCERWQWLGGGFYVLVARKEVTPLTPIRPMWKARQALPGLSVVNRQAEPVPRAQVGQKARQSGYKKPPSES